MAVVAGQGVPGAAGAREMAACTPGATRRALLAAALGGAAAAACLPPGGAAGPGTSSQPATVRVFIRDTSTDYEAPAWRLFDEAHPKVQIEIEKGPETTAEYGAKLLATLAAGTTPDVMYTHPNFFSSIAALNVLADVEKLAARSKFDLKGVVPELLNSVRWQSTLLALPFSGVSNLVVYNAGQFEKRGVPLPPEQAKRARWTWDGFRDTLRRLTLRTPDEPPQAGMPQHFSGMQYISQWVFGAGGQVWSPDLKRCLLDAKPAVDGLEYLAQLHHKDLVAIQPDERDQFGGNAQEGFPTGRVGLRFRATTETVFYKEMAEQGAKLGVAPVPQGPAGVTPRGAANSYGIWRESKVVDAAWQGVAGWHGEPILEYVFSRRNLFPCRQAQFDHPAFRKALMPWEDLEVERAALRDVRIMATPARFTEIDAAWVRLWPQARDGRKSVKDLLAEFLPQANSLLAG
jgi:multiple sugar transport system substrate-binding protein